MIKFFRKIRRKMLIQNKFSKYVLYAIGEIVLVVIGILFALQINNWNEVQKQEIKIEKIYANIQSDLKIDVEEFEEIIKGLTSSFPYYKKIINKKLTLEDLKTCSKCAIFLGGFDDIAIEKGGFNSLQNNSFLFESEKDNILFAKINKFYSLYDVEISIDIEEMSINFSENKSYLKNNKPWYVEFRNRKLTDEIVDYMLNSWDYRNRVLTTYTSFKVHVDRLKTFIDEAQELIEAIDDKVQFGLAEGNHDNGQLKWEGKWKQNKKNDVHKRWYANGQIKTEGLWKNGIQEGIHKKWFENGQIKTEKLWTNGFQDGTYKEWFENGQLKLEELWKNGIRNGIRKAWYENGQKWFKHTFENGNIEGQVLIYHENGQLLMQRYIKDGKSQGELKQWYEDGTLKKEVTYKDGEIISERISFDN